MSLVAIVDASSFRNVIATRALVKIKWNRLGSSRQATYKMLKGEPKKTFKTFSKIERIMNDFQVFYFKFFALLEFGFALLRLWSYPVFSSLK